MNEEQCAPQDLLPVVVEEVDLVRVEKSLHSLGFFASTANQENSRTIVQILRRPDGQRIHAKAVIEGIPSLGLPTRVSSKRQRTAVLLLRAVEANLKTARTNAGWVHPSSV